MFFIDINRIEKKLENMHTSANIITKVAEKPQNLHAKKNFPSSMKTPNKHKS